MSERYGRCKKCWGEGKVKVDYSYQQYLNFEYPLDDKECPRCEGTGMTGDCRDRDEERE